MFKAIGGGQIGLPWFGGQTLFLSNLFVTMLVLAVIVSFTLNGPPGQESCSRSAATRNAARLTGIPVDRIKLQTYMLGPCHRDRMISWPAGRARRPTAWARATSCT